MKLRERWLSSDDSVLNHDIQKALARAFVKALEHIEESYFELPRASELSKEEKKYVKGLFRQLKEQAPKRFSACLKEATQEEDVQEQDTQKEDAQKQALREYLYAADEAAAVEKLWQRIDGTTLLSTENEDFEKFLRENLIVELQFWFGEELKTDNRESNKAWRAFQRLLLEGIQDEVEAVRRSQASTEQDLRKIQQDLQKLASLEDRLEHLREVIDRRSPEDEAFQQGLEEAVAQIPVSLDKLHRKMDDANAMLGAIEPDVKAIRTGVELLASEHPENLETGGHRATFVNTAERPKSFVPRPEELDKLRQAVIGDQITGLVALTGLQGMGGIGKTELAKKLCHDRDIQGIFQDGVVWVRIGREPGNLVSQMKQVGQALGDGLGYYDTPEAGADRLRVFLREKAVLLVLDDVWDARHVEPFIVDGKRCRMLFTTRDAGIALRLDAQEVPLGVLEPEQAVVLLRKWAKRDDAALPDIAKRLGYLPLALKLVGAQLHEGMSGTK